MKDFNTAKSELVKHLQLTFQADDGRIFWYDGTLESLLEFMKVAFFGRAAEKLAKYEDAEEQACFASKPKTYCEKYPTGCRFCDLLLCDGLKDKYEEGE